ncbi:MAG: metal-dependent hydrolase [bacterium]
MTGKTHLAAGAALAGWSVFLLAPELTPIGILIGGFAGLLPDLDASESKLQNIPLQIGGRHGIRLRLFKIPGIIFNKLFRHRGPLHSLLSLIILGIILTLLPLPPVLILAAGVGFLSHLLLDGLTPSGVPLFYPVQQRVRLSPFFKIKTGGMIDQLVFLILAMSVVLLAFQLSQQGINKFLP